MTAQITSRCLCKAHTISFSIPTSSLPLPTSLCSCSTSRHISGVLLTCYVRIPKEAKFKNSSTPSLDPLTGYESSKVLTRFFCSTCGTHIAIRYNEDDHFEFASGTLEFDERDGYGGDLLDVKSHMYIEDTKDGGGTEWIRSINGKELKRWNIAPEQSEELPLGWISSDSKPRDFGPGVSTGATGGADTLPCSCLCGGIQFLILRPDEKSKKARSPFSDLITPYHLDKSPENPNNEPWWLPEEGKYLAGTCTCDTCRLASGFEVVQWAFVPMANIVETPDVFPTGLPIPKSRQFGYMKKYRSSDNVTRSFCKNCGANVFWDGDERPDIIDVAVGLCTSGVGVRADDWFKWWTDRVSFREDGVKRNRGLVESLEQGLKDWGKETYGGGDTKTGGQTTFQLGAEEYSK